MYDANGNLTFDPDKGLTVTNYHHNMPKIFAFAGSNSLEFWYDAMGNKLRKIVKTAGSTTLTQDYLGGIEVKNAKVDAIYNGDGRAFNTAASGQTYRYEYYLKDHQGNIRLSFTDKNNDGLINNQTEILQENGFYPFGMAMTGAWYDDAAVANNNYQYNGKELNEEFGLNLSDYGARWYDAAVGRWWAVDPLADHPNQVGISPYAFLNNNPVNHIDPDGQLPIPLITGAIGAAGGLIYGLVKGKSWKETAALTAGGFVAGATLGFGTAGIAALGGIEAIGGAGATMITLGSGVAGGMLGNAVEQGVKVSLGESSSFSGNEVVLNGALGMSEVVLGPAGKAVEGAAKNAVQDGLSQMFKPASRAEIRSTQRELASQIRASALPGTISKSEAKSAAKQLVTAAQQQKANTLQGTIRISNGAVDVSVSAMQTAVSEETKNKLNNQ